MKIHKCFSHINRSLAFWFRPWCLLLHTKFHTELCDFFNNVVSPQIHQAISSHSCWVEPGVGGWVGGATVNSHLAGPWNQGIISHQTPHFRRLLKHVNKLFHCKILQIFKLCKIYALSCPPGGGCPTTLNFDRQLHSTAAEAPIIKFQHVQSNL